jgi:hypothetical protein
MADLYFKLIRKDGKHFNYTYKSGLNSLNEPFDPEGETNGLFFCLRNDIPRWLHLYDDFEFVFAVDIPQDANVSILEHKLKADKIYIRDPVPILDFLEDNFSPYYVIEFDPFNLRYIQNQNEYLCLLAIEQNPHAIQFAKFFLYEHIIKVCKANGLCLKYFKYQIEDACIEAVKQNGLALAIIRNQTEEHCLLACKQNGFALQFVKNQTPDICMAAVSQNPNALKYVKEQNAKLCWTAYHIDKKSLEYFKPVYKKYFTQLFRKRACLLEDSIFKQTNQSNQKN